VLRRKTSGNRKVKRVSYDFTAKALWREDIVVNICQPNLVSIGTVAIISGDVMASDIRYVFLARPLRFSALAVKKHATPIFRFVRILRFQIRERSAGLILVQ
jgi:hypothetical protein